MSKRIQFMLPVVIVITAFATLGFMLNTTTPDEIGPIGIGIFFLVVYLCLSAVILLLVRSIQYLRDQTQSVGGQLTTSMVAAIPPVMLLALNTIRSIGILDFILALVFGVVLLFYMRHRA